MKKSIFKRIGLIALAVCVAIGSFFVPLKSDKNINISHASDDVTTSYTFNGSSFYSISMRSLYELDWSPNNISWHLDTLLFKASISNVGDLIFFNFNNFAIVQQDRANPNGLFDYKITPANFTYSYYLNSNIDLEGTEFDLRYGVSNSSDVQFGLRFISMFADDFDVQHDYIYDVLVTLQSGFVPNISSIVFDNSLFYGHLRNYVSYIDVNGNALTFYFNSIENANPDWLFNRRVYYLSSDLSDNQIYNQGYQEGLADNQSNIYNNGYNAGYDVGFGQGRQDGIVEANDYSFISLIGAIIDVPVQTFMGLLNFTFLGINLFDFVCAVLTFLLIIFILKLFIGGK